MHEVTLFLPFIKKLRVSLKLTATFSVDYIQHNNKEIKSVRHVLTFDWHEQQRVTTNSACFFSSVRQCLTICRISVLALWSVAHRLFQFIDSNFPAPPPMSSGSCIQIFEHWYLENRKNRTNFPSLTPAESFLIFFLFPPSSRSIDKNGRKSNLIKLK